MNTKRLVITTASLSLCSLMLSNCATIKELREREDPHAMVKKTKVEKVTKKKKKGGFFSFLSNLRKNPNEDKTLPEPITSSTLAKKSASLPSPTTATLTAPTTPTAHLNTVPTRVAERSADRASTAIKGQRRRANGLMMPDAGTLPTNKDLQEVQAPTSRKKGAPGINIPTQP